jgi:hypothetical protein
MENIMVYPIVYWVGDSNVEDTVIYVRGHRGTIYVFTINDDVGTLPRSVGFRPTSTVNLTLQILVSYESGHLS